MSQYYLWGRFGNYGGGFGDAKKEAVMDLGANRIDQQIFAFDTDHFSQSGSLATEYLTQRQLDGAMARDLRMDIKNPRQELPKNPSDIRNIEEIPEWNPQELILSTKDDFEAHDQVALMQSASTNYMAQENMFTDEKVMKDYQRYNTDRMGKPVKGRPQAAFYYGGSAAGRITDNLYDEDGTAMNWLTIDSAF